MRLNLGAGGLPEDGFVNVDFVPLPGIDVVHDLSVFPWPFEDGSADRIKAYDVLEHICPGPAFLDLMAEVHRVLKPGGELWVRWPHAGTHSANTDPTHIRFPTAESLDYWIPGTPIHARYGAGYARGCHFRKVSVRREDDNIVMKLAKLP